MLKQLEEFVINGCHGNNSMVSCDHIITVTVVICCIGYRVTWQQEIRIIRGEV